MITPPQNKLATFQGVQEWGISIMAMLRIQLDNMVGLVVLMGSAITLPSTGMNPSMEEKGILQA